MDRAGAYETITGTDDEPGLSAGKRSSVGAATAFGYLDGSYLKETRDD